jgi:hypothetical protein
MNMDQEKVKSAVSKGLPMPFAMTKAGATVIAEPAEPYKEQLVQTALVIFETIGALGEISIGTIEVVGDEKGVIMDLDTDGLVGTIFKASDEKKPDEYLGIIRGLRAKPVATVPMDRMALVDASILERIKTILQEYVGDFTERVFQNQMKNQGIKTTELHAEDVRRLILALSKATSMIVGRRKGRELSAKLTELVK